MFNRQPFNQGKFNVSSGSTIGNSGIALMAMGANSVLGNRIISASGLASLKLGEISDGTNIKYSSGMAGLVMDSQANGTKYYLVTGDPARLIMTTEANQLLSGEEIIVLDGLILSPGDELVINTYDMTVTLNGQNAMQYFSSESDFIKLLNGLNTIEYSDGNGGSRNISFDILWKDRWL